MSDTIARSISTNVCSHAGTRAPIRYRPGGTSELASTARSRRRSRLRDTADPTARPMANATCGGARSGSRTNEHHSGSVRTRTPSRRRRTKASRSRTRSIKPKDGPGPWPGVTSAPHDRRGCSYAHGSRACGLGGAGWADRYASRLTPDGSRQIMFRRRPPRRVRASRTDLARLEAPVHLCQPQCANHSDVSCPQDAPLVITPACTPCLAGF